MYDDFSQEIDAARQELAMLQAEIETLRARKSIVECVREAYSKDIQTKVLKRKVNKDCVVIEIAESDFLRLKEQAKSAAWVEQKLTDLNRLGSILLRKLNHQELVKAAIQRRKDAEFRCRVLERELDRLKAEPTQNYYMDDESDREIECLEYDDREL